MLKPLTLSLSLAVALGACSVSMAGLFHGNSGCSTCGLASPQSAVSPVASSQCGSPCATPCAPKKRCSLFSGMGGGFCHKPKCYTYTWVLKKKRVWGCGGGGGGCGTSGCNTCGGVYPSGQGGYPSGQGGYSSPQGYGAPTYGAGQTTYASPAPASALAAVPGEMTAAPAGDEAPPAPPAPATATAPSINGPQSSLLFGNPSGN